jgi:hypothetical protein
MSAGFPFWCAQRGASSHEIRFDRGANDGENIKKLSREMYFRDENGFSANHQTHQRQFISQQALIYSRAGAVVSGRRGNVAFRFPHVYSRSLDAVAPHDEI